MKYTFVSLGRLESIGVRLGGAGLGNILFPWATAIVYAKIHNLTRLQTTWKNLKIGTFLRKDRDKRIYFDTLGQEIPTKVQKYLKTEEEFQNEAPVIQRNTDIIDRNPENCKHLCLYVLGYLSKGEKLIH